jgi:hypothetical protein
MSEEKKKRGRKRVNDLYFGPDQEDAVVRFLSLGVMIPDVKDPKFKIDPDKARQLWTGTTEDGFERERIYNRELKDPLNKMIESIIRRYKLYPKDMEFHDIHADTLSFLATKMSKFDFDAGKKAYSYFGTICKNYLLGRLIKDDKKMKQNISYDDVYKRVEEKPEMIYHIDEDEGKTPLDTFIEEISDSIKEEMLENKLNENEIKVGDALVTILDNWETIFEQVESGNKYNKNLILSYIREITSLTTKDIRLSMRRFKKIYKIIKNDKLDQGLL